MAFIFDGVPAEIVKAFAADRAAIPGLGRRERQRPIAAGMLRVSATDRRHAGAHRGCLGKRPAGGRFAAYHPFWFVRRITPLADILFVHAACAAVDEPRRRNGTWHRQARQR